MFEELYNVTEGDMAFPVSNIDQTPVRMYTFNSDNFKTDWKALATDLKVAGIGGRMNLLSQAVDSSQGFRGYRGNVVLLSDGEVKNFNESLLSRSKGCIRAINEIEAGSGSPMHGGGAAADDTDDIGGADADSARGVDCDNLLKLDLLLKTKPEQLTATDRKYIATLPEIVELQAVVKKMNEFDEMITPEMAQNRCSKEWFANMAPGLMCAEFLTSLVADASFSWNASSGCFTGNSNADLTNFNLRSEPAPGNHADTPKYQFSNIDGSKKIPVELAGQARQFTEQQLVKLAVRDANPHYVVKDVFNDALKGRIVDDGSDIYVAGDLFDLGGKKYISFCSEKFGIDEARQRIGVLKRFCRIGDEIDAIQAYTGDDSVFCIEATERYFRCNNGC